MGKNLTDETKRLRKVIVLIVIACVCNYVYLFLIFSYELG